MAVASLCIKIELSFCTWKKAFLKSSHISGHILSYTVWLQIFVVEYFHNFVMKEKFHNK